MSKRVKDFLRDTDGAATVDAMVISAAAIAVTTAILGVVTPRIVGLGDVVKTTLETRDAAPGFRGVTPSEEPEALIP